ncbi:MAG: FecR domain-containing protein [Bacteroidota bacterium]|nr:FecR domain-containing protein [Bacteroidota bacterium]
MNDKEIILLITRVLTKEASEDEKLTLRKWRELDVLNEQQFREYQLIWDQTELPSGNATDVNLSWQQFYKKLDKNKKTKSVPIWFKIAASIIVFGGVLMLLAKLMGGGGELLEQTAFNERKQVQLPDGSIVWLNKNTSIRYAQAFSGETRSVQLNGEAFFEVVKNTEKPFVITASHAVTRVLGTSFNLAAYDSVPEVKLTVTSGKVSFTSTLSRKELLVSANQSAIINLNGETIKRDEIDSNEMAWKTKRLVFKDARMKEVILTLQNYFEIGITVENELINNCHFTGEYLNPSLSMVFTDMAKTLQLSYEQKGRKIKIRGKGCK